MAKRAEHVVFILPSAFKPDNLFPQVRVHGWYAVDMPSGEVVGAYLEVGFNGDGIGYAISRLFFALNPNDPTYNVCDAGEASIVENAGVFDLALLERPRSEVEIKPPRDWR